MTANVALTDTFDQWRVKDNELIIMTQPSGMNNFIKVLDTANSTTPTSGSIITHGGIGVGKSVHIGEDLKVWGDINCVGDTTVGGNLIFGDATTDQVTFEADINSDIIPNTTLVFDLGNTTHFWANTFTGHLTASQKVDSGKPALTVEAIDVDQIAVDINASTTTANAVDISADSITTGTAFKLSSDAITSGIMMDLVSSATITGTGLNVALDSLTSGKVVNISADGLTTGSALYIESNSPNATARHLVSVINNNAAAAGAIPIYAQQDGVAPCGQFAGTTSLVLPAGTDANRGTGVQGGVRFNNQYNFFEGYTGSVWQQFGQVEDADEDTWIRAETSPGADNDDLVLTTAGTQRMKIDEVGLITVGVNGTGYDVQFFGDTASQYMKWAQAQDELILTLDSKLSFWDAAGGENIIASSDGHLEVNAGTTLDITAPTVDINASTLVQIDGKVNVGVNGTGYDCIWYGDTSGSNMTWDQSDDALELTDSTPIRIGDDAAGDMTLYHDGSNSHITNKTGTLYISTDTSGRPVTIGHSTSTVTVGDNLTVTDTITELSMREMKTNIEPIENILPSVLQMQGVQFDWKKDEDEGLTNYGFIAEDVDKILPKLVSHDDSGKARGIQYSKMTAVLLEAIKEQQVQIEELKSKIGV